VEIDFKVNSQAKYNGSTSCKATMDMKNWYRQEAQKHSTLFVKMPMADLMRKALQEYMERQINAKTN